MKHLKELLCAVSILGLVLALCTACKLPDEDYFASLDQDQAVTGETTITAMPEATATQIQPSETEVSDTPEPTATPTATPATTDMTTVESIEERFGLTLNRNFTGKEVPIHVCTVELDATGENIILRGFTAGDYTTYSKEEYDQIVSDGYLDLTVATTGAYALTTHFYVLGESDPEHGVSLGLDASGEPWEFDSSGEVVNTNDGKLQLMTGFTGTGIYLYNYDCFEGIDSLKLADEFIELKIPVSMEVYDQMQGYSNGTALEQYNYYISEDPLGNACCFFSNGQYSTITAKNGVVTNMWDSENECGDIKYYVLKDTTINPGNTGTSADESTASNVTPLTDEQYAVINASSAINFYPNDDYKIGDGACNLFSMTCLVRRMQALNGEDKLLDCQTSVEYNNNTYSWSWNKNWAANGGWANRIYQKTGYKVRYIRSPEQSIEDVENYLKDHPEGIVCYFYRGDEALHSVLITREIGGHFYCIDYYEGAESEQKTHASETLLEDAPFRAALGYSKDYEKLFAYLWDVAYITD